MHIISSIHLRASVAIPLKNSKENMSWRGVEFFEAYGTNGIVNSKFAGQI